MTGRTVAMRPHRPENAFFSIRHGYSRSRFNKRRQAVAVFLNQPDSLRQRDSLRCERGQSVVTAFPMAQGPSQISPAKAEPRSMLPGFRFLLAAIVLSMSILIFGLGAAALLRAAHEEFASIPLRHAAPETIFAQQPPEATKPVLALLRIEPPAAERSATEKVPAALEPAAIAPSPADPEQVAALKAEEPSPPETAKHEISKSEIPAAETPAQTEAAPSPADAPASVPETKVATTEDTPLPANQAALPAPAVAPGRPEQAALPAQTVLPAQAVLPEQATLTASEEMSPPVSSDASSATTKIATLGGPPVTIEPNPPAKAAGATPDDAVKKREQARKAAARRRRIAARARLAQQSPKLPLDPFSQPTITVRSR
jgi:hypothetical protein